MIFYPMACNNGGMLRVTESLIEVLKNNPELPLKTVILSEVRPAFLEGTDIPWIQWSDQTGYSDSEVLRIGHELLKIFNHRDFKWMITDLMTTTYFAGYPDIKKIYDIHFLSRPFYAAFESQSNLFQTDKLLGYNYSTIHGLAQLHTLKKETHYFTEASAFISNSLTSTRDLKKYYHPCIENKPIYQIPVSSSIPVPDETIEEEEFLLINSRVHVQKGIHHIVHRDWTKLPLVLRGVNKRAFEKISLYESMINKGISLVPWSNDNKETSLYLKKAKAVLFPSIYEPWGLSLQEALAMGKICIANKCDSGHEEQIRDGVNGFLLDFSGPRLLEEIAGILSLPAHRLAEVKSNAMEGAKLGHGERNKAFIDLIYQLNREPQCSSNS